MLNAIYASKLYKTSSRKSKIRAAAESPMNVELVAQLAKSLDEEYKTDEYLLSEEDKAAKASPSPAGEGGASEGGEGGMGEGPSGGGHFSGGPSGGGHIPGGDIGSEPGEFVEEGAPDDMGGGDEGSDDGGSESAPEPAESSDVEESTKVKGTPVKASSDPRECKDPNQLIDEVKGLLNLNEATAGVIRAAIKENELWIYFNDNINLNNIMSDVIDTVNSSGYTRLEFNRLARSDNSIVFIINDYSEMVKPLEPVDEKDGVIKEISE